MSKAHPESLFVRTILQRLTSSVEEYAKALDALVGVTLDEKGVAALGEEFLRTLTEVTASAHLMECHLINAMTSTTTGRVEKADPIRSVLIVLDMQGRINKAFQEGHAWLDEEYKKIEPIAVAN